MFYDLPFGKNRHFNIQQRAGYYAGGWGVNMINTMTSGLPLNVGYSPTSQAPISSLGTPRPNLTGQSLYLTTGNPINYLNPAAFSVPSYTQPWGNAPRNIVRTPAFYNRISGCTRTSDPHRIALRPVPRRGVQSAEQDEFLASRQAVGEQPGFGVFSPVSRPGRSNWR